MRFFPVITLGLAAGAAALIGLAQPAPAAEGAVRAPAPLYAPANKAASEIAYFAGGCFWGVEGVFEEVKGVKSAVSGYQGGHVANPKYRQVTGGQTGHAETVKVTFDPRIVSYADLLRIYMSVVADPTLLNRQGPDRGPHYRTALFPTSERQKAIATAYIAQLGRARIFDRPIVTRIEKGKFWPAEDYHQDYMKKHPRQPYIVINDAPKVAALKRLYPQMSK